MKLLNLATFPGFVCHLDIKLLETFLHVALYRMEIFLDAILFFSALTHNALRKTLKAPKLIWFFFKHTDDDC